MRISLSILRSIFYNHWTMMVLDNIKNDPPSETRQFLIMLNVDLLMMDSVICMTEDAIKLTLENLDDVHQVLALDYERAKKILKGINFNETLPATHENKEMLEAFLAQTDSYLLEISHIEDFLQKNNNIFSTPGQRKTIMRCQHLCNDIKASANKALKWIMEVKVQFNGVKSRTSKKTVNGTSTKKVSSHFLENETFIMPNIPMSYH